MVHPQASVDYTGTWDEFLTWFADVASCIAFIDRLRWPGGFVCPKCRSREAWRIASVVMTDGWKGYNDLARHGYTRSITVLSDTHDPAHVSMPDVHRVASLLKRWLLGIHLGSAKPHHLSLPRRIYMSFQPPPLPSARLAVLQTYGTSRGDPTAPYRSITGGKS